jgi:hypothetical protein
MTDPIKPPEDDLTEVQTSWGKLPRWKARALALGEIQAVVNDAAELAAHEREEAKRRDEAARRKAAAHALARAEYYRNLHDRLNRAEARCDALLEKEKAKHAAHAALMAAEAACTAEPDPEEEETSP